MKFNFFIIFFNSIFFKFNFFNIHTIYKYKYINSYIYLAIFNINNIKNFNKLMPKVTYCFFSILYYKNIIQLNFFNKILIQHLKFIFPFLVNKLVFKNLYVQNYGKFRLFKS